jgi:molybdopterin converting factor small subunit
MTRVRVGLPAVLTVALGREALDVEAETLSGALAAAYTACPGLEPLLCDEAGAFREHVLCLLETGGETLNTRWMADLERPLVEGDRIVIMQAVSGG